ncbi:MAG TPA: hypothetical protein ENK75_04720, partial [Saprospiraceae bacterium]|nr:hypothetical protein [Saprospiraceae bacterium]
MKINILLSKERFCSYASLLRTIVVVVVFFFFANNIYCQSAGFRTSFAVFDAYGEGDATYCMYTNVEPSCCTDNSITCGINTDLDGTYLGAFLAGETLLFKGVEINNWKCDGADITGTSLNYWIYKVGDGQGSLH